MPPTTIFMDRLPEPRQLYKKHKSNLYPEFNFEMSFFSRTSTSQFLAPPPSLSRKRSQISLRPQDVDDSLSSDLEASFASGVSLHSPPQEHASLTREEDYAEPMDISPAPPLRPVQKTGTRPRAFTSAARLFGQDLSNDSGNLLPSPSLAPPPSIKSSESTYFKKTQRAALPLEWLMTVPSPPHSAPPQGPSVPLPDDAMDVDTSYMAEPAPAPAPYSFSPPPASAAPIANGFNNLFFDTSSPRRSPVPSEPKKRRSLSPEPTRSFEIDNSSSPMQPSPSQSKLERLGSNSLFNRLGKPTLEGLGAPSSSSFPRRPRRPALSAMVAPSNLKAGQSTSPVLLSADATQGDEASPTGALPVRRAFSALIPPSNFLEGFSEESSFDEPDMSSPAQAYSKRQQVKTIRRCDGTDDFRPLTGATALVMKESPSARFMKAGMPGFGDNEAHGKILPCHRVREDGLMRINCKTLDALLDGKYDDRIVDYHIIDCRFDYEYAGGHVPGAVNINTTTAVEELLLGPSLTKPRPSVSGDSIRKTVLVFHCEFSAKRAPTFAKHLRAKDRAMNNHVYPKIHFPEVYILEGGYCQYFKTSPLRCEPPSYVTMDDPTHAASRREDLDQFRKARFGRHKSYAYGDGLKASSTSQQQKRNTAPSGGPNQVFAAANAARTRRSGGLTTLAEDGNTTADADDTDTDLGDSPCPPPNKNAAFKSKRLGRAPLARAETYNPVRMAY
ncbi:hypothetical protein H0H87_012734 [Tephrocybe sp. NHM501043]|nr:hypothetical protein H0H87_012734 [Tephrocybe sp. NHM501043]